MRSSAKVQSKSIQNPQPTSFVKLFGSVPVPVSRLVSLILHNILNPEWNPQEVKVGLSMLLPWILWSCLLRGPRKYVKNLGRYVEQLQKKKFIKWEVSKIDLSFYAALHVEAHILCVFYSKEVFFPSKPAEECRTHTVNSEESFNLTNFTYITHDTLIKARKSSFGPCVYEPKAPGVVSARMRSHRKLKGFSSQFEDPSEVD